MKGSCSLSAPLSPKQRTVWSLVSRGSSIQAIADKLKTTRQYVNQTRMAAEAKLSSTLLDVANANNIQIIRLYPMEALLLGYHPGLKRKTIVTYTTRYGVKVWFWHDNPEEVTNENFLRQTRDYLLDLAKERGISIEKATDRHPAKLARLIFTKLVPEIKDGEN